MLVEFSVENYRSIKERQTFSMVSSNKDEPAGSNSFQVGGVGDLSLLRSAVIYGANASGKTSLLESIKDMRRLVLESSSSNKKGDSLKISPFALDKNSRNNPTEFEVIVIVGGVRYQYGFTTSSSQIYEEWLIAFPGKSAQKWFHRVWNSEISDYIWKFSSFFKGKKKTIAELTRKNTLFLSLAVDLNNDQLEPLYNWFKANLRHMSVNATHGSYTASVCDESDLKKEEVLKFLGNADISIQDLKITTEKLNSESNFFDDVPEPFRNVMKEVMGDVEAYDIKTVHKDSDGEAVEFELDDESHGTKTLFSYAGPWIDTLDSGNTLFVDELNASLHPKIVEYLVRLFNNPSTNKNNAQLIFTTHETSILSQEVLRRDQVWFCEKNSAEESFIYPLLDFKVRKDRDNLELQYLSGRFGAIPNTPGIKVINSVK